jgi:surfeit locus 1 family protein
MRNSGSPSLSALPDFAYRKVMLRGKWDNAHSMLVGPRSREGILGYDVVTPLMRPGGGSTLLVNRGFVTREFATQYLQDNALSNPTSEAEVCGLLSVKAAKNMFTPLNEPEKGNWYWTDTEAMKEYAGGEASGVQAVLVEEILGALSMGNDDPVISNILVNRR